jgi:SAM-dependent methyltransferase
VAAGACALTGTRTGARRAERLDRAAVQVWARLVAATYDRFLAGAEEAGLARLRASLLATAGGRVLEIGAGTGANLPHYGPAVTELVVTEPDAHLAARLSRKLGAAPRPARVVRAAAESLPVAPASVDVVVSTLVLCSVRDPARALAEVRRVLRPAGRLLFLEHVRSDEPRLACWQDRVDGPWAWLLRGCHPNRDTVAAVRAAGFEVTDLARAELPKAPALARPLRVGSARPRASAPATPPRRGEAAGTAAASR